MWLRLSFALAVLLLVYPALSQQTAEKSPDALTILNLCSAQMGTPLPDVTVVAHGTVKRPWIPDEVPRSVVIKSAGAALIRSERGGDTPSVSVSAGNRGHIQMEGKRQAHRYHTAASYKPGHIPALLCAAASSRPELTASYIGLETFGNASVHHVSVSALATDDDVARLTSEFHLFIDAASFVVVAMTHRVFAPDALENHSEMKVVYSDYRRIDGLLMPFRMARYDNGQLLEEVVFASVAINVSISPAEFQ